MNLDDESGDVEAASASREPISLGRESRSYVATCVIWYHIPIELILPPLAYGNEAEMATVYSIGDCGKLGRVERDGASLGTGGAESNCGSWCF